MFVSAAGSYQMGRHILPIINIHIYVGPQTYIYVCVGLQTYIYVCLGPQTYGLGGVQASIPTNGWPQVVTTRGCKASRA